MNTKVRKPVRQELSVQDMIANALPRNGTPFVSVNSPSPYVANSLGSDTAVEEKVVSNTTLEKTNEPILKESPQMIANVKNISPAHAQQDSQEAAVKKVARPRKPRAKKSVEQVQNAANTAMPVNTAPQVKPAAPEMSGTELMINFVKGFVDVYYKNAQRTMLSVVFLFNHLLMITKAFAHLLAPAFMTYLIVTKMTFVSTIIAQTSTPLALTYYLCFYVANAFLWVSTWMTMVAGTKSLKKSVYRLAEVGRTV